MEIFNLKKKKHESTLIFRRHVQTQFLCYSDSIKKIKRNKKLQTQSEINNKNNPT